VFRGNGFEATHAADEVIAKGLLDIVGAETDTAAGTDGLTWRFGKRGYHRVLDVQD
jgi:hypothetical protein